MLLFLTDSREFGIRMTNRLLKTGILTLWAKPEAGILLSQTRDISGMLLDGRTNLPHTLQIGETILDKYPELPAALILPPETTVDTRASRLIREADESRISDEIRAFCLECCGWQPRLSTYSLTVGENSSQTRYLGYPLPLAPREHSILRFLFYRAPNPVSSVDLLSVCFPENTQKAASLAVHINRINRRAISAAGLPLIESVYGKGYRLCAGIVASSTSSERPWDSVPNPG